MLVELFELIVGTTNVAKGRELVGLLEPHGFHIRTLADCDSAADVFEDGDDFAANARKKAVEQAVHLNRWVLADDSGLEVDALGGRPGVYSARYAGPSATDEANNQKLVEELGELPLPQRTAHYYCHVALADPSGEIQAESTGICTGRIRRVAAGTNGFGYDPLFEVVEYHRTFGELGKLAKAALSHRARAMRAVVPQIRQLAESGVWSP